MDLSLIHISITLVVPSAFKKSKPPNFVPSRRVTFEVKDRLLVSALPPSSLPPTFNESVSTVIVPVLTVAASLVAPVVSPAPVSYTHLDVYKRQPQGSVKTSSLTFLARTVDPREHTLIGIPITSIYLYVYAQKYHLSF